MCDRWRIFVGVELWVVDSLRGMGQTEEQLRGNLLTVKSSV